MLGRSSQMLRLLRFSVHGTSKLFFKLIVLTNAAEYEWNKEPRS
jgi:hypothetical protein